MSVDTLRRAFELADSGNFSTVGDIRTALRREKFDQAEENLSGASIQKQLIARCCQSNEALRPEAEFLPRSPADEQANGD